MTDGGPGTGTSREDDIEDRVAAIWAMIADLNPELAKRIPRYLGSPD